MERWIAAPNHEDCYAVSNLGRVMRTAPGRGAHPGFVLTPQDDGQGYLRVRFNKRFIKVHRLIAMAFLGPPPFADAQVNHKDGDKANNHVDNLEWVSKSANLTHAIHVL